MIYVILLKLNVFSVVLQNVFLVQRICPTSIDLSFQAQTLEYRRLICDLVMMYKIVHDLVDVDRNAQITINSASVARNSFLKLYKPTRPSISSVRSHFLCVRCINVWNYSPGETSASTSISAFKTSLVSYNLSTFFISF